MYKLNLSILLFAAFLVACKGGGSTASGVEEGELAIVDVEKYVGVYKGAETVKLSTKAQDNNESQVVEEQSNDVTFIIEPSGQLRYSSTSGSSGSVGLRSDLSFSFNSDARVQFNGRCSSGEVLLIGRVDQNKIIADYSSKGLVCDGKDHRIEGSLEATKN